MTPTINWQIDQSPIIESNKLRFEFFTWTRASVRSSLRASSSLVKTSGYWVFSKARSSWCSWKVVKVVRDLLIFRGLSGSLSSSRSSKQRVSSSWNTSSLLSGSGSDSSNSSLVFSWQPSPEQKTLKATYSQITAKFEAHFGNRWFWMHSNQAWGSGQSRTIHQEPQ